MQKLPLILKNHFKNSQFGFTLVELLVVVAIIVVVIAIAATSYTTINSRTRDNQRQSDLNKIAQSLEQYYSDHGTYPNTNNGGQFEAAGRSCTNDKICCLLGGTIAQNVQASPPSTWKCLAPFNTYIADYNHIPKDPAYNDPQNIEAAYAYSSDGQSYILVTRHYEGKAPSSHLFISPNVPAFYWTAAVTNSPWPLEITNGHQYFVISPNHQN